MLKKIVIRNVNSIGCCELDLTKGEYRYLKENLLGPVVNPIALYGPNGSGKSALLKAMRCFISLMCLPPESLSPFPVNWFSVSQYISEGRSDHCLIEGSVELFFDIDGRRHDYFLETRADGGVSEEYLKVDGASYLESRDGKCFLKGSRYDIEETRSGLVPLLRVLASTEATDEIIQATFRFFRSFAYADVSLVAHGNFLTSGYFLNANLMDLLASRSEEVKKALEAYSDMPSFMVKKDPSVMTNGPLEGQYYVVFEEGNFEGKLPFAEISLGMKSQSLILALLLSLPSGAVFFVDEADLGLPPSSVKGLLKAIRGRDIQVVMEMHNTFAMKELRPDQIYFASWSKGYSSYRRLSDIYPNIREVNYIEKMYLSSTFDAGESKSE